MLLTNHFSMRLGGLEGSWIHMDDSMTLKTNNEMDHESSHEEKQS